jgi:outer membrane cobalamin receptor
LIKTTVATEFIALSLLLINLSSSYAINNNAKVLLNIKNATDKNYTIAKGYNQPSRTIEIGLDYQF